MSMGFETRTAEGPAHAPAPVRGGGGRRGRRGGRRAAVISTISTVVFLAVVAGVVAASPGASKVVESFFSLTGFRKSWSSVSAGFWLNIKLMLVSEALVLVFALAVAVVRSLPGPSLAPLRIVAVAYTDIFRGVPLILVIFIVGLGVPGLQLDFVSEQSVFTYGVVSLVLVYSAYVAEVYRAGIESVHGSQRMAARSLGLSYAQALRYVVAGVLFIFLTIPLARYTDHLIRERELRERALAG